MLQQTTKLLKMLFSRGTSFKNGLFNGRPFGKWHILMLPQTTKLLKMLCYAMLCNVLHCYHVTPLTEVETNELLMYGSYIILADDGFGDKIHIPSVSVPKAEGNKLVEAAQRGQVIIELAWDLPTNHVVGQTIRDNNSNRRLSHDLTVTVLQHGCLVISTRVESSRKLSQLFLAAPDSFRFGSYAREIRTCLGTCSMPVK